MEYNLLQISLEDDLYLFFRVDGSDENIAYAGPFRAPYIRKKLVSHKDRVRPVRPHDLHSTDIIFCRRLVGITDIVRPDIPVKHFHPRLLIIGDKAG